MGNRAAGQGIGFSTKAKMGKVFGICTPSITASGYLGRDATNTLVGQLGIAGNIDCELEMFGYGIYGGAGVGYELEIFKGGAGAGAQGTFSANIYIAAGDKKDPFLKGAITAEMSVWSYSC